MKASMIAKKGKSKSNSSKTRRQSLFWSRPGLASRFSGILLSLVSFILLYFLLSRGSSDETHTIIIKRGNSPAAVIKMLVDKGITRHPLFLKAWAKVPLRELKQGEYIIPPYPRTWDLISILWGGKSQFEKVTIPEGSNGWQIQSILSDYIPEEEFWQLWRAPRLIQSLGYSEATTLEGLLAADSYNLDHSMEPEEILNMMIDNFKKNIQPRLTNNNLTPYQTLTLASLVEEEAVKDSEREEIAGIFINRLNQKMPLQCDPTVQYSKFLLGLPNPIKISKADLKRNQIFNTYIYGGLPPGPISSPSRSSVKASARPLVTSNLYFVSDGELGHTFSATIEEHSRAVIEYRLKKLNKKTVVDSSQ